MFRREVIKNIVQGALYEFGLNYEDFSRAVDGPDFVVWRVYRRLGMEDLDQLSSLVHQKAKFFGITGSGHAINFDSFRNGVFIIAYSYERESRDEDGNTGSERAIA